MTPGLLGWWSGEHRRGEAWRKILNSDLENQISGTDRTSQWM
jgi:hypothetical protein